MVMPPVRRREEEHGAEVQSDPYQLGERLRHGWPKATLVLVAANIAVFAYLLVSGEPGSRETLVRFGARSSELIARGEIWRLVTAIFLHGGVIDLVPISVIFFILDIVALFAYGSDIERIYGPGRLVGVFFAAGIAGSLASWAFSPGVSVSATGALFGLIGLLFTFGIRYRKIIPSYLTRRFRFRLLPLAVIYYIIAQNPARGIDNFTNIAGLLVGVLFGILAPLDLEALEASPAPGEQ